MSIADFLGGGSSDFSSPTAFSEPVSLAGDYGGNASGSLSTASTSDSGFLANIDPSTLFSTELPGQTGVQYYPLASGAGSATPASTPGSPNLFSQILGSFAGIAQNAISAGANNLASQLANGFTLNKPVGVNNTASPTAGSTILGMSTTTWLLIGGAAVVLLLVLKK